MVTRKAPSLQIGEDSGCFTSGRTMQPWRFVTEGITNPMDKCTRHLALRDPSDYLLVQYINGTIPPWNEYMALRESGTLLIPIITWRSSDKN